MIQKSIKILLVCIFIMTLFPVMNYQATAVASSHTETVAQQTDSGWQIEKLADVFPYASNSDLDVDSNGYPHLPYIDTRTTRDLFYTYQDINGWHTEIVDLNVEYSVELEVDANNFPHITYITNERDQLKYAYKDLHGWHIEDLEYPSSYIYYQAMDLSKDNQPHLCFYDETNIRLIYAYRDLQGWHFETVADTGDSLNNLSLKLDLEGYPHIGYFDFTHSDFRYLSKNDSGWQVEIIGQAKTYVYSSGISIAFDHQNQAHFTYHNDQWNGLQYAYFDRGYLRTENVRGSDRIGRANSLALSPQDLPFINYTDEVDNAVGLAYKGCPGWHTELIESGTRSSAAMELNMDGTIYISYIGDNGHSLKIASKQIPELIAGCAATPIVIKPYPVFQQPGVYPVNRCDSAPLWVDEVGEAGRIKECVPSVEVRRDGYREGFMQFNFKWTISLDDVPYVNKYSDTYYKYMYIVDNLGNRYDHVEVGGQGDDYIKLYDGDTIEGWFLFEPAKAGATQFTFYDDDQGIKIEKINLEP